MDNVIESHLFPFHFLYCHCTVTVALPKEMEKKRKEEKACCIVALKKLFFFHLLCGLIYPVYHINPVDHFTPLY